MSMSFTYYRGLETAMFVPDSQVSDPLTLSVAVQGLLPKGHIIRAPHLRTSGKRSESYIAHVALRGDDADGASDIETTAALQIDVSHPGRWRRMAAAALHHDLQAVVAITGCEVPGVVGEQLSVPSPAAQEPALVSAAMRHEL